MRKLIVMCFGATLILTLTSSLARAEDLSGRFGAGFTGGLINVVGIEEPVLLAEMLPKIPFLSAKYHINSKFSAALLLGYNSLTVGKIKWKSDIGGVEDDDELGEKYKLGVYGIGAKCYYNLIEREKINFYLNLGLIYQSGSEKWTEEIPIPPDPPIEVDLKISLSEIDFIPGAGAEYFPVENLGISLEFGIKYRSIKTEYEEKSDGGSYTEEQKFSVFSTVGSIFDVGIHYYFF